MATFLKTAALCLAFVLPLASAGVGAQRNGTLTIEAAGFKAADGQVVVAVYREGKNWLEIPKAFRVVKIPGERIQKGKLTITVPDLPFGEYGVTVLHDKNRNSRLDMRWFPWPKPKEDGGVSNNYEGFGKPDYDDARFRFNQQAMTLQIRVR